MGIVWCSDEAIGGAADCLITSIIVPLAAIAFFALLAVLMVIHRPWVDRIEFLNQLPPDVVIGGNSQIARGLRAGAYIACWLINFGIIFLVGVNRAWSGLPVGLLIGNIAATFVAGIVHAVGTGLRPRFLCATYWLLSAALFSVKLAVELRLPRGPDTMIGWSLTREIVETAVIVGTSGALAFLEFVWIQQWDREEARDRFFQRIQRAKVTIASWCHATGPP